MREVAMIRLTVTCDDCGGSLSWTSRGEEQYAGTGIHGRVSPCTDGVLNVRSLVRLPHGWWLMGYRRVLCPSCRVKALLEEPTCPR
jgi:hypothetical protein